MVQFLRLQRSLKRITNTTFTIKRIQTQPLSKVTIPKIVDETLLNLLDG